MNIIYSTCNVKSSQKWFKIVKSKMKTKDIVSPVVFQVVVLVILKLTGVNGKRKSQMKMVLGGIEDFSKETSHL